MPETETPRHYTTVEAAERLSVSKFTIARLIKSGQLRPTYIGRHRRVSAVELNRFLADLGEQAEQATP